MSLFSLTFLLYISLTNLVKKSLEKENSITKKHKNLLFLFVLTFYIELNNLVKKKVVKKMKKKKR